MAEGGATGGVLLLCCGGTFDKSRFTRSGKFVCGEPAARALLRAAGVERVRLLSVLRKDSLDMDDADRELVAEKLLADGGRSAVVIHGTDTMVETAMHLRRRLGEAPRQTVVLTGSMRPAVFAGSDAAFNLGYACACAQLRPPGAWIAMHGRCWPAERVRKDRRRMRFTARKP